MEKISRTFTIYTIVDSRGEIRMVATIELDEPVRVAGLVDKDGHPVRFEDDVIELPGWCLGHGLKFSVTKREITTEI